MFRTVHKWKLITGTNPDCSISEQYRLLRTNIELSVVDGDTMQVIMVTSAVEGEGKSTTAANLAVAYAGANHRVLLMDANLRKPEQHHIFKIANHRGLTNVLLNDQAMQESIQHTDIENLEVMAAGSNSAHSSGLLSSKRIGELLDAMREMYDVIIIDTPSVMRVADARIVASQCDGVVLVVDSGKVKKDILLKARNHLEHAKAQMVGVVLNNIHPRSSNSYSS